MDVRRIRLAACQFVRWPGRLGGAEGLNLVMGAAAVLNYNPVMEVVLLQASRTTVALP